jgi:peptidoglycan/xylan/chitin deacetylase (PgdA/CDA1 family)
VYDQFASPYTITPAQLESHIRMLKAEGYAFYRLADVERLLQGGEGLPTRGVMLTFDDGYQSFATQVLPLAQKYQVPVVSFAVTKYHTEAIIFGRPHMADVEARRVIASGWGEIASHSHDGHRTAPGAGGAQVPVLTQPVLHPEHDRLETQAEYEARVRDDFARSAQVLARLGATTGLRHYAFPFTARSADAVRLGQEAGFRYFYVGGNQLVTPDTDPTAIPRIQAGMPHITAEMLKEQLRTLFGVDKEGSP